MVSGAFSWDALGWYNVRSLGHYVLEATSINEAPVTLVGIEDVSSLAVGDEVEGFVNGKSGKLTTFYVTDVTEDEIALQDTKTSFGYVREKQSLVLQPEST